MPLRPEATLERFLHRGDGHLPDLVGFRVRAIEENRLAAELDVRTELLAPNGYLHAATVIALADTACGYACIAHLPIGAENFTTIEPKCNFIGTARDGTLECVATPAHLAGVGRDRPLQGRRARHRGIPLRPDGALAAIGMTLGAIPGAASDSLQRQAHASSQAL